MQYFLNGPEIVSLYLGKFHNHDGKSCLREFEIQAQVVDKILTSIGIGVGIISSSTKSTNPLRVEV